MKYLLLLLAFGFGQLNIGNNAIKIAADSTVTLSYNLVVNGTITSNGDVVYMFFNSDDTNALTHRVGSVMLEQE